MTNFYIRSKNTGVGAISIPWCGKKIIFNEDGSYPSNTNEYLHLKMTTLGSGVNKINDEERALSVKRKTRKR